MNPSYEYMSRIRREEQAKLLDMRRERVLKALDGLTLHGDSHAMLSQIAYAIHPHVGAWDAESCDHLRNVLAELIGEAREAASGAQRHSPCGAGGCDCRHEQTALETERHKAVRELRKLGKCSPVAHNFREAIAAAVAVPKDGAPYDDGELCHLICDRLIHLLGGDLSHDTSHMRQESETEITDELRKYVSIHETTTRVHATMPPQMEEEPTHKGKKLLAIADRIDAQFARVCEQQEMVLQDTIEQMQGEAEKLQVSLDELSTQNDMLKESERLRRENAECAADAINKACMYLDLLRDAARDYKELRDRLLHVVEVCQSYTEAYA